MKGRVSVMIALTVVTGCGGGAADPEPPETTAVGSPAQVTTATDAPSDQAPSTTTSPEPAQSGVADPCAVLSSDEIAAFIEPGTEGIESEFSTEYIRECDWFTLEKGFAIQVHAAPNLDSLSDWGDVIEDIPGHAREVKVVYLEDDDTVVTVGVDAGDRTVLVYTVERIQKGSSELDDLISLGLLAADRVAS